MKKTILFLCACLCIIYCNNNGKRKTSVDDTFALSRDTLIVSDDVTTTSRDTLIVLSTDWAIYFSEYNEKLELWYNPRIVDLTKKDTMKITEYPYECGSELFIKVSPDLNFFILDYVHKWELADAKGFEHEDETFMLGYGRQFCSIIDIKNAVVIGYVQRDCSGEWDNENNWLND